jgi:hypothetical protein
MPRDSAGLMVPHGNFSLSAGIHVAETADNARNVFLTGKALDGISSVVVHRYTTKAYGDDVLDMARAREVDHVARSETRKDSTGDEEKSLERGKS